MTLLEMSLYGAVIILAIILIRAFTLYKLPKKTFLILWGVALLRLLVPFEISSGFSVYSLLPEELSISENADVYIPDPDNPYEPFQNYADYVREQGSTQIVDDDVVIVEPTGGAIYLPNETPDVEAVPLPNTAPDIHYTNDDITPDTAQPDKAFRDTLKMLATHVLPYLPTLWLVGTLLCAVFFLVSYIRCYREFRTSLPVTEDNAAEWLKQHTLKRTIAIRQSDKISAPLTYGIFRPVILMPKKTDWNNFTQLDYVLYHEFTHIRRFDLIAKLVMIIALCLHWFNPFVWAMYFFFNRDLELSCDDCVVKHFAESKSTYAKTLLGMEETKSYSAPLCNHFSKNAIEERITAIMKSKKTTIGRIILAVALVAVVVITLTTSAKAPTGADNTPTATPTVSPTKAPVPTEEAQMPLWQQIAASTMKTISGDTTSYEVFKRENRLFLEESGLQNVTIDLSSYSTDREWWENGVFYDQDKKCHYIIYVLSPQTENTAGAGVLFVTVPEDRPEEYTILPLGNATELKNDGVWFDNTIKIGSRIYLNTDSHSGNLWYVDTETGTLHSLAYVNDTMETKALSELQARGLSTQHNTIVHTCGQVGDLVVYSGNISYTFDNDTDYLTLYLVFQGENLVGEYVEECLIVLRNGILTAEEDVIRLTLSDLVRIGTERFNEFYTMQFDGADCPPYTITGISHSDPNTIRVDFVTYWSEALGVVDTEGTAFFTYDFEKGDWVISNYRETTMDYLSSVASYPTLATEEVIVSETGWNLTVIDELCLPSYSQLKDAGAVFETEAADNPNIGMFHTASLNGISYFFVEENADEIDSHAFHIALTSPDYSLSGGARVGMTVEDLLSLYPELAKTKLTYDDPVFNALYGPSMFNFRDDQFPESFLAKYDYAYTAHLDKGRDGLPVCIAFLIKNGTVAAITVYMPTAG